MSSFTRFTQLNRLWIPLLGAVVLVLALVGLSSIKDSADAASLKDHGKSHSSHHGNSKSASHGKKPHKAKSHDKGHASHGKKSHAKHESKGHKPEHSKSHGSSHHSKAPSKAHGTHQAPKPGKSTSGHNPPGNNGTIKIDALPFDDHPNNEPHVGCTFQVDFYGYDKGNFNADVIFALQNPTLKGRTLRVTSGNLHPFIGEDDASGGGSEAGLDASETYTLAFTGAPHPKQGYHVKLTVHAPGSQGSDVKHKVFWVKGCGESPSPSPSPSPSHSPSPHPSPTPKPSHTPKPTPTTPSHTSTPTTPTGHNGSTGGPHPQFGTGTSGPGNLFGSDGNEKLFLSIFMLALVVLGSFAVWMRRRSNPVPVRVDDEDDAR